MTGQMSAVAIRRNRNNTAPRVRGILNLVFGAWLLAMMLIAPGCGGGGGGSSNAAAAPTPPSPSGEGELIVGITDAEGDFVTYTLDIEAVTLFRANGDTVETLPLATRIDFTELTQVTEFLTIATVPEGNYVAAAIRMDFSDAEIFVQDENGDALAATAVDDAGDPLDVFEMRLELTTSDVIRIRPGIPAAFSLDFDLDASNEIDFSTSPPTVTVDPLLLATPELETDREHRVRGVLDAVDASAGEFDMKVRPFRHRTGQFGEFTVMVDADTQYEIDGEGYTGQTGLEAMSGLAENTPVVASGGISGMGMMADIVIAGSSVPWADADVVKGVVAARVDDTLTVKGAHVEFADGTSVFRGTYTVNVDADTSVSAPGLDNASLSEQSISVGQRVVAWGEFADDRTLIADRVRMQMNQLTAEVVTPDPLVVDVFYLNGRRPAAYDFSGTGVDEANDAEPAMYDIDTGLLGLSSVDAGDLVRVRGIVNEFGLAPPDYLARTVIDVQTDMRSALLFAGWSEGTADPFTSIAPERIDVDLAAARKALTVRGVPRDFIDELESVALLAPGAGRGVYAVKVRGAGEVHVFRSFDDLVTELIGQLDAGRLLHRITAQGKYNVDLSELTAGRAGFVFRANEEDG